MLSKVNAEIMGSNPTSVCDVFEVYVKVYLVMLCSY